MHERTAIAKQGAAPRAGPPPLAARVLRRVRRRRRLARDHLALRDSRRDRRQQAVSAPTRHEKTHGGVVLNSARVYLLGLLFLFLVFFFCCWFARSSLFDTSSTHSTMQKTKEESMVQTRKTRTQNAARHAPSPPPARARTASLAEIKVKKEEKTNCHGRYRAARVPTDRLDFPLGGAQAAAMPRRWVRCSLAPLTCG